MQTGQPKDSLFELIKLQSQHQYGAVAIKAYQALRTIDTHDFEDSSVVDWFSFHTLMALANFKEDITRHSRWDQTTSSGVATVVQLILHNLPFAKDKKTAKKRGDYWLEGQRLDLPVMPTILRNTWDAVHMLAQIVPNKDLQKWTGGILNVMRNRFEKDIDGNFFLNALPYDEAKMQYTWMTLNDPLGISPHEKISFARTMLVRSRVEGDKDFRKVLMCNLKSFRELRTDLGTRQSIDIFNSWLAAKKWEKEQTKYLQWQFQTEKEPFLVGRVQAISQLSYVGLGNGEVRTIVNGN